MDPFGIDVVTPRLSLYSESHQREQKQTVYHISVSKLN